MTLDGHSRLCIHVKVKSLKPERFLTFTFTSEGLLKEKQSMFVCKYFLVNILTL